MPNADTSANRATGQKSEERANFVQPEPRKASAQIGDRAVGGRTVPSGSEEADASRTTKPVGLIGEKAQTKNANSAGPSSLHPSRIDRVSLPVNLQDPERGITGRRVTEAHTDQIKSLLQSTGTRVLPPWTLAEGSQDGISADGSRLTVNDLESEFHRRAGQAPSLGVRLRVIEEMSKMGHSQEFLDEIDILRRRVLFPRRAFTRVQNDASDGELTRISISPRDKAPDRCITFGDKAGAVAARGINKETKPIPDNGTTNDRIYPHLPCYVGTYFHDEATQAVTDRAHVLQTGDKPPHMVKFLRHLSEIGVDTDVLKDCTQKAAGKLADKFCSMLPDGNNTVIIPGLSIEPDPAGQINVIRAAFKDGEMADTIQIAYHTGAGIDAVTGSGAHHRVKSGETDPLIALARDVITKKDFSLPIPSHDEITAGAIRDFLPDAEHILGKGTITLKNILDIARSVPDGVIKESPYLRALRYAAGVYSYRHFDFSREHPDPDVIADQLKRLTASFASRADIAGFSHDPADRKAEELVHGFKRASERGNLFGKRSLLNLRSFSPEDYRDRAELIKMIEVGRVNAVFMEMKTDLIGATYVDDGKGYKKAGNGHEYPDPMKYEGDIGHTLAAMLQALRVYTTNPYVREQYPEYEVFGQNPYDRHAEGHSLQLGKSRLARAFLGKGNLYTCGIIRWPVIDVYRGVKGETNYAVSPEIPPVSDDDIRIYPLDWRDLARSVGRAAERIGERLTEEMKSKSVT
jgi:hypothetical protein